MVKEEHFEARVAERSVVPTLLCGHCGSILSRARVFRNQGAQRFELSCDVVGLCQADDCGALNCCDAALANLDNPSSIVDIAS